MPKFFIEIEAVYQAEVEADSLHQAWYKVPYVERDHLVRMHTSIIERHIFTGPVIREDAINLLEDKAEENNPTL